MAQDGNGVDLVNEARKRDFKKALSQVPRYNGTTPWRLWKMEFVLFGNPAVCCKYISSVRIVW